MSERRGPIPSRAAALRLALGLLALLAGEGRALAQAAPPPAPAPAHAAAPLVQPAAPSPAPPAVTTVPTPTAAPAGLPGAVAPGATVVLQPIDQDAQPLQTVAQDVQALKAATAKTRGEAQLSDLRKKAAAEEATAESYATKRARQIAAIDQKLRRLSTAKGAPRPHLTAAEEKERQALVDQRAKLTGQVQAAKEAGAAASQAFDEASNKARTSFVSHVFRRTSSPLEAGFWTALAAALPPDSERLARVLGDAWQTAVNAPEPRGVVFAASGMIVAIALGLILRRLLKRWIARRAATAGSGGRFRRSARAVSVALIDTALPGAAVAALYLALSWAEVLSNEAEALARALVVAVFWGAAVLALSRQLAGSTDPEERMLPVSERLSRRMVALPWLVASITGAGYMVHRVNHVVGASVAATIAANSVVALAYAGVASLVLLALADDRPSAAAPPEEPPAASPGRALLSIVLSFAILVTVGAVFAGFTTFAALVSTQMFWISVVIAAAYLLLRFVDDALDELFKPHGWIGRLLSGVLSLPLTTVRQIGVLASALLQILIVLAAFSLALTPFGRNGEMLSLHFETVGRAIQLGSLVISPKAVAAGVASLLIGLALVNIVERWVNRRFLPVTTWDIGVRTSVSTGLRYLGIGLAVVWALAAAGLGFRQIALVASALSVGIGFGLQQIVQNFVSGVILLVERPVKVGDWVSVGGVEGDVKRIRVRATEIETFDRAMLIVPNSDLISKAVQNRTLDPRGRVQLQLTIGAAADAPRARDVIGKVLADSREVLKDPKPSVLIDSLTQAGAVNFNAYAYVASQRDANRIKSDLYGRVIEALGEANIGFAGGPTEVVLKPSEGLQSLVDGLAPAAARATEPPGAEPPPKPPRRSKPPPPA